MEKKTQLWKLIKINIFKKKSKNKVKKKLQGILKVVIIKKVKKVIIGIFKTHLNLINNIRNTKNKKMMKKFLLSVLKTNKRIK